MKSQNKVAEAAFPLLAVGIVVGLWETATQSGLVPTFILPPPSAVFKESIEQWRLISVHALPTAVAVILGFVVAFAFSATAAVLAFSFRAVRLMLEPLLIVSQIIPKVALAPVLLVAFGNGMTTRVLVAAIIAFSHFTQISVKGLGRLMMN